MNQTIESEKFLQIFLNQFEETAKKNIGLNSPFRQIEGWSSLQALVVTVAIHDEWGVSFTDEDFKNSTTVNDLYLITRQKSVI